LSQKNFKVKNGLSVNDTEVIDSNAQVDWARLKNRVVATGVVAGEMSAVDKSKLDGIENAATADQTAAEIRTLVASATDSNVFTDAHQTKLGGIATSADVTSTFIKDEDNMVSNSATHVPSQQSTKAYVDTQVNNLVNAAPAALDTLDELALALGDDANFATTVTNSIATKLPLAGGTMTGNIVMSGAQTVDGRDLSADGSKLDGIAVNANNYSHPSAHAISEVTGLQTSLDGKVDDSQVQTNVPSGAVFTDTTYSVGDGGLTQKNFTTADNTKLDGIEAGATADQTWSELVAIQSTAPTSPSTGDMWFDDVNNAMKVWSGSGWDQMSNKFSASGGTETTYSSGGVNYRVHTFTSSGTFTAEASGSVNYLVVAGGGSGGSNIAGGGGAGGFRTGTLAVAAQSYVITVGAGGAAGGPGNVGGVQSGNNGTDSIFSTITSIGGGAGGPEYSGNGNNGGSGGGGSRNSGTAGSGTSGQGNNGGNGTYSGGSDNQGSGGGGGGAGAVGAAASNSAPGNGGAGLANSITGSSVTYAGGGGGGGYNTANSSGGSGGGGNGSGGGAAATVGTANIGGGGGAGGYSSHRSGKSGGSGIVVIRYAI